MEAASAWIRDTCDMQKLQRIGDVIRAIDLSANPLSKYAVLALILALGYLLITRLSGKQSSSSQSYSSDPEKRSERLKPSERKPGTWPPSTFQRPPASPYPNWSVTDTKPLPYRPFRYGPYHITMGIRPMPWDEWIELDNHYRRFHADKKARIASRGSKCSRTAPEALPAALELLQDLAAYLPERYPSMFTRTPDGGGIRNTVTNEEISVREEEDPIQLAARLIQDDLALLLESPPPDGQPRLLAGSILLAGFWRLSDKFGLPLSEIHTSGAVPQFTQKLEKGMLKFFRRLKPEKPVVRNNYFFQVDSKLAWSESLGDEDAAEITGWKAAEGDRRRAVEAHFFRSERQSLRRLPRTGAVVFTIRTYFHPISELAEEWGVPGRLASAVRSWGEDVGRYKGRERYEGVLLEFLDRKHAEQVRRGLDAEKEEEEGRRYPW
ncbi:Hypothetical predicted protein [Lecanosticta acicola]|uniref:Alpha-1,2-mannosyltransferase n=1 Tax=Lecanosticta acicola TaxID=111012 RepID=A0AAI8YZP3_9PEZI|nr:Hypothetical predicted protein [Lecanosticta acicola]